MRSVELAIALTFLLAWEARAEDAVNGWEIATGAGTRRYQLKSGSVMESSSSSLFEISGRYAFSSAIRLGLTAEKESSRRNGQKLEASGLRTGIELAQPAGPIEARLALEGLLYSKGSVSGADESTVQTYKYEVNYTKTGFAYRLAFVAYPSTSAGIELAARFQIATLAAESGRIEFEGQSIDYPDRSAREMRSTDLTAALIYRW